MSNSRIFSKKSAIIHGKSLTAAHVVAVADYGVMVLLKLFLMGSYARCCLSFIAVRIVVVWSDSGPKGILSAFRLRLRRSDRASPANRHKIDGCLALAAAGSVTGSDCCAKGSKFIWATPGVKVSWPALIIFCSWVRFRSAAPFNLQSSSAGIHPSEQCHLKNLFFGIRQEKIPKRR